MAIAYSQDCFIAINTNLGKSQNNSKELNFVHLICRTLVFVWMKFRRTSFTK